MGRSKSFSAKASWSFSPVMSDSFCLYSSISLSPSSRSMVGSPGYLSLSSPKNFSPVVANSLTCSLVISVNSSFTPSSFSSTSTALSTSLNHAGRR